MMLPPIYFYLPPSFYSAELPTSSQTNWAGFGLGIYAWTLQTYLRFKEANFPCELTNSVPERGIVFFHSNALRESKTNLIPGARRLLICLKAEATLSAVAHLHVVQNPVEASPQRGCYFIPHWTQPGLISRDRTRGERFENITFYGHLNNLDPALSTDDWHDQLQRRGLQWRPIINQNYWHNHANIDTAWNDYQHIDAIIAIRRFQSRPGRYREKPATKLYNAWLAGVPAILGVESAFRATGTPGLNYLEADSLATVLSHLDRLRCDQAYRQVLVEQGHQAGRAYQPEAITAHWQRFLEQIAIPAYWSWCDHQPWQQQLSQWGTRGTNIADRALRRVTNVMTSV